MRRVDKYHPGRLLYVWHMVLRTSFRYNYKKQVVVRPVPAEQRHSVYISFLARIQENNIFHIADIASLFPQAACICRKRDYTFHIQAYLFPPDSSRLISQVVTSLSMGKSLSTTRAVDYDRNQQPGLLNDSLCFRLITGVKRRVYHDYIFQPQPCRTPLKHQQSSREWYLLTIHMHQLQPR